MDHETRRVDALKSFRVLDTGFDSAFDKIVTTAAMVLSTPIALVSLVDDTRQWFKAAHGLNARETPRGISFCQHAIEGNQSFIVEDAWRDERFRNNPLVTRDPNIRFYAGTPLIDRDGYALGTLCAIDTRPRSLDDRQILMLEYLADSALNALYLHRQTLELADARDALAERHCA
tara:strand:- start:565 stop:1089 length:525 start_codon:yes stop_codon:yes gene_type:complete